LTLARELIAGSEQWVPELKKRLGRIVRETDALPQVASFFAIWSLHLLQGIFTLIHSKLYSGSLLLLRSLIEAHMELSFILHRECGKRAAEYLSASKENRPPYRGRPGFETDESLGKRSGRCGLGELYRKTYLTLSVYSHLRIKGSLAVDPGSEKSLYETTACLIVGEAMLAKISRQLSRAFRFPIPKDLSQKYADGLRRYRSLIRRQEEALAQKKAPAQTP